MNRRLIFVCLTAALALAASGAAALKIGMKAGAAVRLAEPSELEWKPSTQLPPGAEYHLIREDPETHGIQVLARFPAKYAVPEHAHPCDETIVVLKGKLWIRAGDLERVLAPGSYAVLPAGVPHELRAKTIMRDVVFIAATSGPYDLKYTSR